ncbi:MAG TPA: CvpA family protein [Candidatus Omnitrophota bacterium]|nr:CvpA family protein [Candidatus Omnitrophota bacterium]
MSVSMIDLYIIVGALVFFVIGVRTGFLRAALSVLAVYAAIYVAQAFAPVLIRSSAFMGVEETKAGLLTMTFIIFGICYLALEFILVILKSIISISILGPIDKLLGGLVSIFKAFLIAGMIINSLYILPLTDEQLHYINQSFLKDWAIQCYLKTYPLATTAAQNTTGWILNKLNLKMAEPQKGAEAVVTAVTAEATKLKSTLDALPKY